MSDSIPVRCLGGKVILEEVEIERKHGAIVLPNLGDRETRYCKVVAVGPGSRAPLTGEIMVPACKVGDHVVIPNTTGRPLVIGRDRYLMIDNEDIDLVIDDLDAFVAAMRSEDANG